MEDQEDKLFEEPEKPTFEDFSRRLTYSKIVKSWEIVFNGMFYSGEAAFYLGDETDALLIENEFKFDNDDNISLEDKETIKEYVMEKLLNE